MLAFLASFFRLSFKELFSLLLGETIAKENSTIESRVHLATVSLEIVNTL